MRHRMEFRREVKIQPQGVLGCLVGLALLAGAAIVGLFLFWPIVALILGVALGFIVLALLVVAYLRLRRAIRSILGRRGDTTDTEPKVYEAEVTEPRGPDRDRGDRPRLSVQVRRRPHRD